MVVTSAEHDVHSHDRVLPLPFQRQDAELGLVCFARNIPGATVLVCWQKNEKIVFEMSFGCVFMF